MSGHPRRAAITGIGVVAPNGTSTDTFWKSTKEGISVLDRITREGCGHLPLRVAGEVRDFDPPALVEERYLVQTDRFTHFAMAAATKPSTTPVSAAATRTRRRSPWVW